MYSLTDDAIYVDIQTLRSSRKRRKVNFKQNLTGLNTKFSFKTGCHKIVKELSLPYYLFIYSLLEGEAHYIYNGLFCRYLPMNVPQYSLRSEPFGYLIRSFLCSDEDLLMR